MKHSEIFYEELKNTIKFHEDSILYHNKQIQACMILLNDESLRSVKRMPVPEEAVLESKGNTLKPFPVNGTKEFQAILLMRDFIDKKALTMNEVQIRYSELNNKGGDITASVRLSKKSGIVKIQYSFSFVLWGFADMLNADGTDFRPECIPARHWDKINEIRSAV